MSEEPIDIAKWKFQQEQKRLEKIMLERYGSVEAELEAFLQANREGQWET